MSLYFTCSSHFQIQYFPYKLQQHLTYKKSVKYLEINWISVIKSLHNWRNEGRRMLQGCSQRCWYIAMGSVQKLLRFFRIPVIHDNKKNAWYFYQIKTCKTVFDIIWILISDNKTAALENFCPALTAVKKNGHN